MMNKMISKYKRCMFAGVCAAGMMFSVASQAVVIDDFNVASFSEAEDRFPPVDTVPASASSAIDGSNIVMDGAAGWTRTLIAELTAGDDIATEVCVNCQAAHVTLGSGNSNGVGTFRYENSVGADLTSWQSLSFDWGATFSGADVEISFSDGTTTQVVASWSDLLASDPPGSGTGDLNAQALMAINWGSLDRTSIERIDFTVTGVPNLNSIIDNVAAVVPIPAAAYLFGTGLLALLGVSRRKSASV